MNDAHFNAQSARHHKNLDQNQIQLLKNIGKLIDTFEQKTGSVVGADISFDPNFIKSYSWNGEILR